MDEGFSLADLRADNVAVLAVSDVLVLGSLNFLGSDGSRCCDQPLTPFNL
jgi:hypothetical protein